jgi:hypothetical protein
MKKPLKHIFDYLLLCLILSLGLISLIYFNGNPVQQRFATAITAVAYVIWGIYHHKKEGSISQKVAFEYLIYGLLGSVLIIGLI